jgi:hypothetical protein
MRRFFGSKVASSKRPSPNPLLSNRPLRRCVGPRKKSNLTKADANWWHAYGGLSARALTKEELAEKFKRHEFAPLEGDKWWTVEYSRKYKSATWSFFQTVLLGGGLSPSLLEPC